MFIRPFYNKKEEKKCKHQKNEGADNEQDINFPNEFDLNTNEPNYEDNLFPQQCQPFLRSYKYVNI